MLLYLPELDIFMILSLFLPLQPETEEEKVKQLHQNVVIMAHFAFELVRTLNRINRECFNDLKMRIGEHIVIHRVPLVLLFLVTLISIPLLSI